MTNRVLPPSSSSSPVRAASFQTDPRPQPLDRLTKVIARDKLTAMNTTTPPEAPPESGVQGHTTTERALSRAERSRTYRDARAEYARIRELRKVNPIAAHLRERRLELGFTQEYVAEAAGTSHTNISRLERGMFTPKLETLRKIASILDEELLVCFQRVEGDEIERELLSVAA
jgi:DNA-binding XRE family transcriptional regulator